MKKLLAILFVCSFCIAKAQEYNVMLIPDSLRKNADVVIRNEEYVVEIKSLEEVRVKHKYAITILNEKGDDYAAYSNSYNNHHPLKDIDGNLYDATGKKLKNVKRKDIQDAPMDDGFSLMGDWRIKYHNWYYKTYPYTVEYEDEQESNETFGLPGWSPVNGMNCAIENSTYTIEYAPDFKLRYMQFNYKGEPQISNDKTKVISWHLKNFKAVNYEPYHPPLSKLTPYVLIASTDFIYEGYHGSMASWNDLGKFQLMLNKDRDVLPDNIKKDVHDLTDGLASKEEKVNALYQYMQKNSRYISIQLGIGGMQPFDAKYVADKKYGDCKALSNYMVALLKEAGIGANYVEIKSQDKTPSDYLVEDFPNDYFDHVICCVPNGKDTIWLECTNQTKAAGFMGSFTGNRKALLIADDGGHVVSTPFYKASDNLQSRSVTATIDADGNLDAFVRTTSTGEQEEGVHDLMYEYSDKLRETVLNNVISLPTYKVEKSTYSEDKKRIPAVHEELHITSPNCASITGKRLFIRPNFFNKSERRLSRDSVRMYDIQFSYPYQDIDSVSITLPSGYALEAMPKEVSITGKFGIYHMNCQVSENVIKMVRVHECTTTSFPASDYNDLVAFYDAIYKADRSQLVFVKKDN